MGPVLLQEEAGVPGESRRCFVLEIFISLVVLPPFST